MATATWPPPSFHLLAKPTGAICNLDCTYCFFLSKEVLYPGDRFRMSDDVLEAYIRQLIEAHADAGGHDRVAGRRTDVDGARLLPPRRRARRALPRPGQQIEHTIQTNGTLLDDEWGAFFADNEFLVGLSIDGPRTCTTPTASGRTGGGHLRRRDAGVGSCCERRRRGQRPLHAPRRERRASARGVPVLPRRPAARATSSSSRSSSARRDASRSPTPGGATSRARPAALHPGRSDCVTEPIGAPASSTASSSIDVFDEWVRRDVGEVFVQMFDVTLGAPASRTASASTRRPAGTRSRSSTTATCTRATTSWSPTTCSATSTTDGRAGRLEPKQRAFGDAKRDTLPR